MNTEKRATQGKWKSAEEMEAERKAREAELEGVIEELWKESKHGDESRMIEEAKKILGEEHVAVIRLREITRQVYDMRRDMNRLIEATGRLCAEIVLEARHKQREEAQG